MPASRLWTSADISVRVGSGTVLLTDLGMPSAEEPAAHQPPKTLGHGPSGRGAFSLEAAILAEDQDRTHCKTKAEQYEPVSKQRRKEGPLEKETQEWNWVVGEMRNPWHRGYNATGRHLTHTAMKYLQGPSEEPVGRKEPSNSKQRSMNRAPPLLAQLVNSMARRREVIHMASRRHRGEKAQFTGGTQMSSRVSS